MIYTGIGSRRTPEAFLKTFTAMAEILGLEGLTLRSGGACGADQAFEQGAINVGGDREIYLPFEGFQSETRSGNFNFDFPFPSEAAFAMGEKYHPRWHSLSVKGQAYHARNCHQVLGWDLETPTSVVICWTAYAKGHGGTGQALRIAKDYDISIVDFGKGYIATNLERVYDYVEKEIVL